MIQCQHNAFWKKCISIMEICMFKIAFQIPIPKTISVSQHSHNDKAMTQTNWPLFIPCDHFYYLKCDFSQVFLPWIKIKMQLYRWMYHMPSDLSQCCSKVTKFSFRIVTSYTAGKTYDLRNVYDQHQNIKYKEHMEPQCSPCGHWLWPQ